MIFSKCSFGLESHLAITRRKGEDVSAEGVWRRTRGVALAIYRMPQRDGEIEDRYQYVHMQGVCVSPDLRNNE